MGEELLKYSFKKKNSDVAYCALTAKVGTRDEQEKFNGMAHLMEHMLFKGTEKRSSSCINSRLEKEGGDLNAYTTKEEIVLYCTVLKDDLAKGIDLLLELALTSIFPQKELAKELEVVYDEIITYKDSPADQIFDDFEAYLFEGHPLGKLILGSRKTLKRIKPADLMEFRKSYFCPSNLSLAVVAGLPQERVRRMVSASLEKYTGSGELTYIPDDTVLYPEGKLGQVENSYLPLHIGVKFAKEENRHLHQTHCIIGCSAYSYYDTKERCIMALVSNMLGGPASNSMLNTLLRERHALVYNVEAAYTPYSDTGLFTIYFGCDAQYLDKCRELVYSTLDKFVCAPVSESKLKSAKKQFIAQMLIASDNAEAQALGMGKSMLVFGQITPFELSQRMIEDITAQQLQDVCAKVLARERLSELVYC